MQGHAQMPLRAFLRALDLVVQHEEREAAPRQVSLRPSRWFFAPARGR